MLGFFFFASEKTFLIMMKQFSPHHDDASANCCNLVSKESIVPSQRLIKKVNSTHFSKTPLHTTAFWSISLGEWQSRQTADKTTWSWTCKPTNSEKSPHLVGKAICCNFSFSFLFLAPFYDWYSCKARLKWIFTQREGPPTRPLQLVEALLSTHASQLRLQVLMCVFCMWGGNQALE